jgi:hypothetical protein
MTGEGVAAAPEGAKEPYCEIEAGRTFLSASASLEEAKQGIMPHEL